MIHQLAFEIYNSTALKDEFSDESSRCESYNELAESTINKVNVIRGLSVLVAGTSIFSLVIIILTIDAEEKLRAHPAKLIRMICLDHPDHRLYSSGSALIIWISLDHKD